MADSLNILIGDWLRLDQNEETIREVQRLQDEGNIPELERRMVTRIEFGTAGLRGPMGAGWSRMNDLIVLQASQGLCAYVLKYVKDAASRGVVIGYDHRHNSGRWAELSASVFVTSGVKTYLYEGLVHTPMVPFGVKKLSAACGIMITASHNPKDDNGYKVYWENAVQIISPHDAGISDSIKENLTPRQWGLSDLKSNSLCVDKTDTMREAYFNSLDQLCQQRSLNSKTEVKFVNTSMHGVGDPFAQRAFKLFGLPSFIPVKEQQSPDPNFSTVKFPNPEEKGALDLALRTADQNGVSYVLAQDPDADRFSAAEKTDVGWTTFTGDQLGALFAAMVVERYQASGKPLEKLAIIASTVSSKMVETMAQKEGFKFSECLTGFKFIGNTALQLVEQGYEVPFGYEEAIGFMFGTDIRDKDGIAATVLFAELVVQLRNKGKSVKEYLHELYARYGYFQTNNSYFICRNPKTIEKIFSRIRNYTSDSEDKKNYPRTIANLTVTSVIDLTFGSGYDSKNPPTYEPSLPLSSGYMVQFRAKSVDEQIKIVLTIRTSGTEPKIKYYLEGNGADEKRVGRVLRDIVSHLGENWMEASKNNLEHP